MKVKCIKIYNDYMKQYQEKSPWLTIGKEYIVLEIKAYPERNILYRLVGDNSDKSPALYDALQFETITNKIPSNWAVYQSKEGILSFRPESWQRTGFWEDCFDGESNALDVYKREAKIIYEEENVL